MSARQRLVLLWGADRGGDAVWDIVLLWTAAQAGSPQATAVILAAGSAPPIIAPLFGGVIAEMTGSWRMLRCTSTLKVATALAITLVLLFDASWGWLAVLAAIMGLAEALHMAPLFALPAQIKGHRDETSVQRFVNDTQATGQAALLAATPLTGLILGWESAAAAAMCAAVLVGARLLLRAMALHVEAPPPRPREHEPALAMLRAGLRYAWDRPQVRAGLVTFAVANVCVTPVIMIGLPFHALDVEWTPWMWGLVYGAYMGGGIVGPVASNSDRVKTSLAGAWLLLIPGAVGMGVTLSVSSPWAAAAGGLVAGACFQAGVAMTRGVILTATEEGYRSRVQGLIGTSAYSLIAVSHLAFGTALAAWSVSVLTWSLAAALSLFALSMLLTARRACGSPIHASH